MALKNLFKFGRKKKKEDEIEKELEVVEELEEKKAQIEEEIKKEVSKISEEIVKDIDSSLEKVDKKIEKTKEKPKLKPLKDRLATPKKGFFGKLKEMLLGKTIDDDLYEELEELLIQSDIGMNMTIKLVEELEKSVAKKRLKTSEAVYEELKELLKEKLINNNKENTELKLKDGQLNIILVVGVNGVGKTTSIGKIAKKLKDEGKKVIIGAGDTFRAAAIEQVEEWGNRVGVEVIKQDHGSDPAAVIFDAVSTARNKNYDVVILDTAGRLHNKRDLMKELEKINKIIRQQSGQDEFETLLVIDSTTGQNGLEQARIFNEIVDLTGIILTKFDGTAKGGIIFPITAELEKPIKFIGVGEGIEDLRTFDTKEFVEAMFED
jgi:signal recognition particle-docking protein ftsY